ncbi:glycerophosphodiester phosphodiesterase [Puteibacter caeruleilacunae]|nr:glycerophosphodiester phosphodiesterase [Puteibacter caeruleilacunae]
MRIRRLYYVLIIGLLIESCSIDPIVIAHRGASGYAIENTISSVDLAMKLDADAIEIDVWKTIDDSLIVFHDRDTKRFSNDSLVIPASTYQSLRNLKIHGNDSIPLLRDVLKRLDKTTTLVIEIKCCWEPGDRGNIIPQLKELLKSTGTKQQVALIAFNIDRLITAKKEFPKVPMFWMAYKEEAPQMIVEKLVDARLDGIHINYDLVKAELVEQLHQSGLKCWVWTVNDSWSMYKMIKLGVDGITTNYPDRLLTRINNDRQPEDS